MAASAFKQQCPSCEAMVPIKDPSFIGRKIDCPKCKYRFVVEDPGADEEDAEERVTAAPAKGAKAVRKDGKSAAAAPAAKKGANGKAAPPGKKKPGARARRDADDEDGSPAKKKKARPMGLILGLGLGAFALVVVMIVVGIVIAMNSGGGTPSSTKPPGSFASTPPPTTPPATNPPGGEGEGTKAEEGAAKPAATANPGELTNLLPNDAETVLSIHGDRLLNSSVGQAAFETPGGFRQDAFQRTMGFPFSKVDRVVWSAHHYGMPDGWQFSVVRLTDPVSLDVLKNLRLVKDPKSPLGGFDFYTITGELDSLSRFLFTRQSNKPLDVHLFDDKTLVFAHQEAMQSFLGGKRERKPLTELPATNPSDGQGDQPPGEGPGGFPSGGPGSGSFPPGGGGPGGGLGRKAPSTGGGSGPPVSDAPPGSGPPASGPPASGPPGGFAPPGGMRGQPQPKQPATLAYLTIKPELKEVLDELESGKEPVILSAASVEGDLKSLEESHWAADLGRLQPLVNALEKLLAKEQESSESASSLTQLKKAQEEVGRHVVLGFALQQLTTSHLTGRVGYNFKNDKTARQIEQTLRTLGPQIAKALGQDLGLKMRFPNDQNSDQNNNNGPFGGFGPGGMQPGMGPGGGGLGRMTPGTGGGGPASGPPMSGPPMSGPPSGPGSGSFRPPMSGPPGGAGGGGFRPPMSGPGGGMGLDAPPGSERGGRGQPAGGEGEDDSKDPDASSFTVQQKDTVLVVGFDLNLNNHNDVYGNLLRAGELVVLQARGREDMSGHSRLHELAAALKRYADKNGRFPRGTADRKSTAERAFLPWPPNQRVSWMAELLPYLGQGEFAALAERVRPDASWGDKDNLVTAQTLIPYYLAHDYPSLTWWGLYPGTPLPVANTHFVGVAGVGVDAATYAADDPAVAKKLGVFGYDRSTKVADVKDGAAKTIALLQVPADYKTPWLAGGGSTVRGVPETGSVKPFVCATYNGKRGTFAVMADGRVRFVPETISDKDFQALCTIAGGEDVDVDKVAPVVPAPETKAVTKTTTTAPPAAAPTTRTATGEEVPR